MCLNSVLIPFCATHAPQDFVSQLTWNIIHAHSSCAMFLKMSFFKKGFVFIKPMCSFEWYKAIINQ